MINRRNEFVEGVIEALWDRFGMNGPTGEVRSMLTELFHDAVISGEDFDTFGSFPDSNLGHTNFTQLRDLNEATLLRTFFTGDCLDLGHGDGRVVFWARRQTPVITMSGVEGADIPRHVRIPPVGFHAGFDQWLATGDFMDVDFNQYGTLFYSFNGSLRQADLAAKIAAWNGRLIIYARGATPSDVRDWIALCGGTIVQAWPGQNLVAVDV